MWCIQGKFVSDQSVTGLSYRSLRPAMFGTLSAADAGARGSQLPSRFPGAGITNFSSNGIFNLPRYYPTYQQFDNEDDESTSTWLSGEHERTIPFYRDQPVDDDDRLEPIYSRPNKSSRVVTGVVPLPREQFTVALGTDFETSSHEGRCRCTPSTCCHYKTTCCTCRQRHSRAGGCCNRPMCSIRPICVCTIISFILLTFVAVFVAVFLAVLLVNVTGLGM